MTRPPPPKSPPPRSHPQPVPSAMPPDEGQTDSARVRSATHNIDVPGQRKTEISSIAVARVRGGRTQQATVNKGAALCAAARLAKKSAASGLSDRLGALPVFQFFPQHQTELSLSRCL